MLRSDDKSGARRTNRTAVIVVECGIGAPPPCIWMMRVTMLPSVYGSAIA